jgi:predicted ATPase/DNA-binding SARP family transcriptional activator
VEIGILGPLEVRIDGRAVGIAGSRLRTLVTRLALDAPAVVSTAELIDALWPQDPPADPINALQSLISRVRRTLGAPDSIQQVGNGYRLSVDRGSIDAAAFAELVATGRREMADGSLNSARDSLNRALGMWRGTPLTDAGDADYALAPTARLDEQRLDAQADRIEIELRLGHAGDVVGDLEELVAAHPLRERLAAQLMRALAATGRTADALAIHEQIRARLADDLGVDPGAELSAVQLAVLRGEVEAEQQPAPPQGHRRRSNLRSALTSFIGREAEVARVSDLLERGRLVTVVGPGGAGKTRLANEIARQWISRRADGVWLVELAPVTDGAAIPQAMLGALGLLDTRSVEWRVERATRQAVDQLLDVLADSDCLLLVDNCEHLIAPVASLIDLLLASCPDLLIVATSREPLGIVGESLCLLPPLGLPPVGVTAAEAMRFQAVRLFVERAQAVSAGFAVDQTTVVDVIEIVRRLDGLPLAIELAAARLRVMPTAEIAVRLSDRFRLLTGGSRTAMPRHRTLRAVVEWSWELLAPDERLLAERLSVFPAGATVETAAAVCADDLLPTAGVGDLLLALVDKSLLTMVEGPTLRFRMLETIREYGAERLAERGEALAARTAHARYFAAVAAAADPLLRTADQLPAIRTLRTERDNILASVRFLAESIDPADRAACLDLVLSLTWHWTMTGADSDTVIWLDVALAATEDVDHPGRVWAQAAKSLSMLFLGTREPATDLSELQAELREISRQLDTAPPAPIAPLMVMRSMLAYFSGDLERAEAQMAIMMQSPDGWLRAAAMVNRALYSENEGELDRMRVDIEAAHEEFARIGDRWGLSSVLSARGTLRSQDGDLAGAIADYEVALQLAGELGSTDDDSLIKLRLAGLRLRTGDVALARKAIEEVRAEVDGRAAGLERTLFADGVLLAVVLQEGDLVAATAMAADMRQRVAEHPPNHLQAHAAAVVGATTAIIALKVGDVQLATADLIGNYPLALTTGDMPIIAAVGVSVGWLASALGRTADAASILGAAARLRGSEDHTEPHIAELTRDLRASLGPQFDELFDCARALDRASAIARIDPSLLIAAPVQGIELNSGSLPSEQGEPAR